MSEKLAIHDRHRRRRRTLGVVFALSLAPALSLPVAAATSGNLPDPSISDAIEEELLSDRVVPMSELDIRTRDGIVTLTGTVDNLLSKTRAARIASAVKGVRSVVNRIDVEPTVERTDRQLENSIAVALADDTATEAYEVTAQAENGVVTLTGMVDSWQEEQLAIKVAKGVAGVEEIDSQIDIVYGIERPDSQIKAGIEGALRYDVLVDDGLIDVAVDAGRVTLTGKVGSAAERNEAYADAWVTGVESVDVSGLEVVWWADENNLRQNKYVVKSDDELGQAIQAALKADPRVSSFAIKPEINAGTVTLRGAVDSLKAKRGAARDVKNTVGVRFVENDIKVRPEQSLSDMEIATVVRNALIRDPFVEPHAIDVDALNGVVNLSGTVDTWFERGQADDVTARVDGVLTVDNNLVVTDNLDRVFYDPYVDEFYTYDIDYAIEPGNPLADDAEIAEAIEDHMWWSPFVDADDVYVTVDDGVALLTGTIGSWTERKAATENAYDGGALLVNNELAVL